MGWFKANNKVEDLMAPGIRECERVRGNKWWREVHELPVPVTVEMLRKLYAECIASDNLSEFEEDLNHAMREEEGS